MGLWHHHYVHRGMSACYSRPAQNERHSGFFCNAKWLYTVAVSHDVHVDFFGSQEYTSGCSMQLDFSVPDSSDFISQALALQTVLQVKA